MPSVVPSSAAGSASNPRETTDMARGVGGISPANLQKYLSGLSYPAHKRDLMSTARRNKAPDAIMDLIERLPDEEFGGPQEVQRAYGDIT